MDGVVPVVLVAVLKNFDDRMIPLAINRKVLVGLLESFHPWWWVNKRQSGVLNFLNYKNSVVEHEASPLDKLAIRPQNPPMFSQPPWLRIEQRGAVALVKALPAWLRQEVRGEHGANLVPCSQNQSARRTG